MKNKILKIAGLVLFILISFAFATPYILKGRIQNHLKRRLNRDFKARSNFSNIDISWFRHFPHMAVGLDHLQVIGIGEFSDDTLIAAKQLDISFSLLSTIFGDSIRLYALNLEEPRIHAIIHKNGRDNWNILKTSEFQITNQPATTKPLSLDLQGYSIHHGYFSFINESTQQKAEIVNVDHEGKGDFRTEEFSLKTKTTADAVSYSNGGAISWVNQAKASMNIIFQVDKRTHTYSFHGGELAFNHLNLNTEGFFQQVSDSAYNMDLKFDVPSTDFKNILSMVPSFYNKDFDNIKTQGSANFTGLIKGRYDNKHRPAFHVYLDIKNGFFQYADLQKAVQNINLFVHIDNQDGLADHTIINIPRGHIEMASDTLDFHLLFKNGGAEPLIDAEAKGKIDFAKIAQWSKLDPGTKLKGMLLADAYVHENGLKSEKHGHESFKAGGSLDLSNFSYSSIAHPGIVSVDELLLTFHPENVLLNELKGEWMTTHFTADGSFNNIFTDLVQNKPMEASIHVNADELSLNDWMGIPLMTNSNEVPARVVSNVVVPAGIIANIRVDAGKVHYDNLDLENLSGNLQIADETIKLNDIKADALDGSVLINGSYSTKSSIKNPEIKMTYDAKTMDIQKTFFAFNTVQKILPVGKFISGKLSAQVYMSGRLGDNMKPDLGTLSGEGNIQLIEGEMKDFGPFDKLAQSLDIAQLHDLPVNNINSSFSFKNNKVQVNDFTVNVNGMEMEIGGSHGFDQSLNYGIKLKVPTTQLGEKGRLWVKNEVSQAASKGIPVQLGRDISMNVVMSGTINSPLVETDMNDMISNAATDLKAQVDHFVNAKLDSARQQLRNPGPNAVHKNLVKSTSKNKNKYKAKKGPQLAHNKTAKLKGRRKSKSTKKYYS